MYRSRTRTALLSLALTIVVFPPTLVRGQPRPGAGPIPVVVGTVIGQPITTVLEVVGTVEPSLATTVSTEIAGLVMRFDLKEGDPVQQGKTVLAQLKATDVELALAEAEAELVKARETARKLKRGLRPEEIEEKRAEVQERKTWMEKYAKDLERAKSMRTRDIASVSELDLAESTFLAGKAQYERVLQSLRVAEAGFRQEDVAAAEAEVQRLQSHVQRLKDDVQKTIIRAPVSGFITQRFTEIGQWLERGGKVADLIDLRTVLVRVPVHEKDISSLKVGNTATLTLDALPDHPLSGRVKHIIPLADAASRTFPVKIEVANTPDHALKAGMFARVRLQAGATQTAIMVPKDAVVRQAASQAVFVVQEDKVHLMPIKTGRAQDGLVEVLESTLQPGDRVVVTGNETLRDQAPVLVKGNPTR